mgnify:CR=1 FL=1
MSILPVRKAVKWLEVHQNDDGGWGESCSSYVTSKSIGQGPSTPSQTSWALIALLSAGEVHNPVVSKGIRFLVDTQGEDGSWGIPPQNTFAPLALLASGKKLYLEALFPVVG